MRPFVDSSIWVRWLDLDDPLSLAVRLCLFQYKQRQIDLVVSSQTMRELWSVLTRPRDVNGLGLSPSEAEREVAACLAIATIVEDTELQFARWRGLVVRYRVAGRQVHDANHVAFMLCHGIKHVLTLDRRDFDRYAPEGIHVLGLEDPL